MKVTFECNLTSVAAILASWEESNALEKHAPGLIPKSDGAVWRTCGGHEYRITHQGVLIFEGSRVSFSQGASWGGIYRDSMHKHYFLQSIGLNNISLVLLELETSWEASYAQDPCLTEEQLLDRKVTELQQEAFEAQGLEIERQLGGWT